MQESKTDIDWMQFAQDLINKGYPVVTKDVNALAEVLKKQANTQPKFIVNNQDNIAKP